MSPDGSGPVARPARREQRSPLPLALLALAGALAALHLALPVASVPRLAPRAYNEGWNAYHADAVLSERPLYPLPEALFPNNYPPLSFAVAAVAGQLSGDTLRAGRFLALLALLVALVEVGWIAWRATGDARLGAFAGLALAAVMGAGFDEYVGMNDPQWLAHAPVLGGLLLLLGGRSPARTSGAAALMLAGGLVKHNLLALPLAVTVWLFGRDRPAFRTWLAASLLLGALAVAALASVGGFFESLLGARTTSFGIAAEVGAEWLRIVAAPLALGILAAQEAWRDPEGRLLALWAGLGLVLGFALTAGEGVSYNAYFDLVIALCLLGPFLVSRVAALVPAGTRVIATGALALALLLDPLLRAPDALLGLPRRLDTLARYERVTREDVAYLAARPGPAVCEMLALCYWAGKPPGVDLFNAQQLFRSGRADEEALLERVANGEFGAVHVHSLADRDDERVSGQLARALQLHYVIDRASANGLFLRPRRAAVGR